MSVVSVFEGLFALVLAALASKDVTQEKLIAAVKARL